MPALLRPLSPMIAALACSSVLDLGALLDAFGRIQRVTAQVAGPQGQHKAELRRPARMLAWGR